MPMPHIAIATSNDVQSLIDLEKACFTSDQISRRQYHYLVKSPSVFIFILKNHQQSTTPAVKSVGSGAGAKAQPLMRALIIGSAILLLRNNSHKARLYSFAIHPAFRQQGHALALHRHLEKQLLDQGIQAIRLEVRKDNATAMQFYQKLGYRAFGEYANYYADRESAVRMSLLLDCGTKRLNPSCAT